MEKERAIELLIQAVDEIPHLKTLHYQNDEIKLWLDKVGNILRAGLKPEDYSKYWPVSQALEILKGIYEDNIYQEEYLRKITDYELALKSILLKYEVVGMEGKRDKGGEVEMTLKISKLDELQTFKNELVQYSNSVISYLEDGLTEKEKKRGSEIYNTISKKVGYLGSFISELSGIANVDVHGKEYDMWLIALKMPADKLADSALGVCLLATNKAIGKLTDDINKGKRDRQGNVIGEPLKDTSEAPSSLFDRMQFHPRVITASKSLFKNGHYAQAILEAYKAVNNFVKEKTVLAQDGKALMSKVFSEDAPIIKLNELLSQSDRDEQEGFKFLFMGAMVGIRNPKAHDNVIQTDPHKTLEYLGFASLLMRKIEEGKVVSVRKHV